MPKLLLVYDVGYGALKNVDTLIELLKSKGVEVVVDVRAFPKSKKPGFSGDELKGILEVNGIKYVWLGDRLGGYRSEGYERYMESDAFKSGMKLLLDVVSKKKACLLCLEKRRRYCHRRFIVNELKKLGFEVRDLVEDGEDV